MLVEIPRTDGIDQPVLVAGNPIKLSNVPEGPDRNVPLLGEHTTSVLAELLGLDDTAIADLEADGVVAMAHLSPEAGG
jgi:crotonobetainyl-CoA:carnitine CoA-transferase CaiB-like acyl-CoA transferase